MSLPGLHSGRWGRGVIGSALNQCTSSDSTRKVVAELAARAVHRSPARGGASGCHRVPHVRCRRRSNTSKAAPGSAGTSAPPWSPPRICSSPSAADRPKNDRADLNLYLVVGKLQRVLVYWSGTCPTCHHTFPTQQSRGGSHARSSTWVTSDRPPSRSRLRLGLRVFAACPE